MRLQVKTVGERTSVFTEAGEEITGIECWTLNSTEDSTELLLVLRDVDVQVSTPAAILDIEAMYRRLDV